MKSVNIMHFEVGNDIKETIKNKEPERIDEMCDIMIIGCENMDILIDNNIDKEPLYYTLSDDKVINITGEGGSGKSTYSNKYKSSQEYIVIDYDLIVEGNCTEKTIEYFLRNQILEKYGKNFFSTNNLQDTRKSFSLMYDDILQTLLPTGKTIVLDGTQLRFIQDVNKIKGNLIVLRPSIETCIHRSVMRKKLQNPSIGEEELKKYKEKRRKILYQLNPLLNELIINVDKKINTDKIEFTAQDKIR